jgi:transposase
MAGRVRGGVMAEPARARRLSDEEGRRLQHIVRRGKRGSARVRPAMIIMASASGTLVSAIARLVAADQDTVRDVIHLFNAKGLAALDPRWAGGRPRRISDDDVAVIVAAAGTRPERLGLPFTHWNLRKLAAYSAGRAGRRGSAWSGCGRSCMLTGSASSASGPGRSPPTRDAKLDRIEYVTSHYPERCFAFDQFGPLSIRPVHGSAWAERERSVRLPATYPGPMASAISTATTAWAGPAVGRGTYRRARRDWGADRRQGTGRPARAAARDFTGVIGPLGGDGNRM